MPETKPTRINSSEMIEAELYDDLLGRYERALVYAGELREKLRAKERALEEISQLKKEVRRLEKTTSVEEAYIRLLESALKSLGILSPAPSKERAAEDSNRITPLGSQ